MDAAKRRELRRQKILQSGNERLSKLTSTFSGVPHDPISTKTTTVDKDIVLIDKVDDDPPDIFPTFEPPLTEIRNRFAQNSLNSDNPFAQMLQNDLKQFSELSKQNIGASHVPDTNPHLQQPPKSQTTWKIVHFIIPFLISLLALYSFAFGEFFIDDVVVDVNAASIETSNLISSPIASLLKLRESKIEFEVFVWNTRISFWQLFLGLEVLLIVIRFFEKEDDSGTFWSFFKQLPIYNAIKPVLFFGKFVWNIVQDLMVVVFFIGFFVWGAGVVSYWYS
ncbi:hypothetical protein HK098_007064 [Nowakowskiella sp. JEL0407]|nr:hypothetical protein HK098_007064 [Nowakowskiella sp. JEL0407]